MSPNASVSLPGYKGVGDCVRVRQGSAKVAGGVACVGRLGAVKEPRSHFARGHHSLDLAYSQLGQVASQLGDLRLQPVNLLTLVRR